MTRIEVFDPPMCCSSGVCGPLIDPLLAAFAADVDWLTTHGVTVTRHNLAREPQAFVSNALVQQTLQRAGEACLPLVLVNGEIAAQGPYSRRHDLARLAGVVPSASSARPKIPLSSVGAARLLQGAADLTGLPFTPTRVMLFAGEGGVEGAAP